MSKNPISIEVLETLDAIDRRGSFAKAAEELNKATSAVSYTIQKLEEQLDIALFRREGRRSVLTPPGQLILEEGRHILRYTSALATRAQELATGWEAKIKIAVESLQPYPWFFVTIEQFLQRHPSVELDICECVLNGGWDALQHNRVDLIVGAPGPAPKQMGFRSIGIPKPELIPVISTRHPAAKHAHNKAKITNLLPNLRRVITHDTTQIEVARSEGLSTAGKRLYVQNVEQKTQAIVAGIGIGHLPIERAAPHLDSGTLLKLNIDPVPSNTKKAQGQDYIAWHLSNKGKGLQALIQLMQATIAKN